MTVFCDGEVVARHERSWAKHGVITDPAHQAIAVNLCKTFAAERKQRAAADRQHADRHVVALRALPDYDALFGVDFTTPATKVAVVIGPRRVVLVLDRVVLVLD